MNDIVPIVVVHGGAGDVTADRRDAHVEGCKRAAAAGLRALLDTDSAVEAAQRAVEALEDDALFNAGTGACLDAEGGISLDAALMEGTSMNAGAVAALPPFANPVRIARTALDDGKHVLYAGDGAARFAVEHGHERSTLEAMRTESAQRRLEDWKQGRVNEEWAGGTVGAIACDAHGRLAAATSTGGTVGKHPSRVGDTPILGSGTYADDDAGACSTTGVGETIMRACLARVAVDLVRAGAPPDRAADQALRSPGRRVEVRGGLILLDPMGRAGLAWNTHTMSHAIARRGEDVIGGC